MHKFFAKTEYLGKKVIFLPQCHSTNEEAQRIIKSEPDPFGTVVISQYQTKGRGQRGNEWKSEPQKNALFSLILRPEFITIKTQFKLHVITSLAIYDALFPSLGGLLRIKWPNDIYYKNQKLGGILIENSLCTDKIENSVIGIGLNVNQENFDLPNATSLFEITQKKSEVNELIETVIVSLEKRIKCQDNHSFGTLKREYERRLFRFDEMKLYRDIHGDFQGRIIGIDDTGKLIIEKSVGIQLYDLKEVAFL